MSLLLKKKKVVLSWKVHPGFLVGVHVTRSLVLYVCFPLGIVLSVLRFTECHYQFGIFKVFFQSTIELMFKISIFTLCNFSDHLYSQYYTRTSPTSAILTGVLMLAHYLIGPLLESKLLLIIPQTYSVILQKSRFNLKDKTYLPVTYTGELLLYWIDGK